MKGDKKEVEQRKGERCTASWSNRRVPDFECKLTAGHTVHIDPRTGTRWGDGQVPRGMRRKGYTKYANQKLTRQAAVASAVARARQAKEKKA